MLVLVFIALMIGIFGKMLAFAIRTAWGITAILFRIVFLPLVLIGLVIGGLLQIAFPILIIIGIITLIRC